MTAAPPHTDDRQPPPTGPDEPRPKLGISLVQVMAAALAAVTATIAASFLGVAGTVIGAALASVITVTGTAVFSHSLRRTGRRVRERMPHPGSAAARSVWLPADRSPLKPPGGSTPLDRPTLQGGRFADPTYYGRRRGMPPRPGAPAGADRPARARARWRRVPVAVVAVFAGVLVAVTGVELIAGRPLSDLVRGRNGSGTTLFGTHHARRSPSPQNSGPSSPGATPSASNPGGAGTVSPTATATQPPKASGSRGSSTSPGTPSSTAVPSTSSAPTSSPTPGATSGSPTHGVTRGQSAAS